MTCLPAAYQTAQRLEHAFGSPQVDDNVFSYRATMERDENEHYPEQPINFLNGAGVNRYYVPAELGGRMSSGEEVLALHRVLARRDLTVNSTYSTQAWSVSVWIAGTPQQKQSVARRLLAGGAPCLAYTEKAHGADLLAGAVTAERIADGWRLDGEKWAINRATRGDMINMVAKTDAGKGPRGLTSFWIDKRELELSSYHHLPKLNTLGVRGLDLSGVGFRGAAVGAHTVIGREGEGLDVALKTLQVTRTFCSSFSLGAGDTMLRLAAEFAGERELYGKRAIDIPLVREQLAQAYANLLGAECISIAGARGLQLFPQQFSTWSAVVKVQAPALVEQLAHATSSVLGARFLMRDQYEHGIFQKFFRDHLIVNVFDGSTSVCLDSLCLQMRGLVTGRRQKNPCDAAAVRALYDLDAPLPAWEFERLCVYNRGQDAVMASLPLLVEQVQALRPEAGLPEDALDALQHGAQRLLAQQRAFDDEVLMHFETRREASDTLLFVKARQYCSLHGAIAALGLWLFNRQALRPGLQGADWLNAFLQRAGAPDFDSAHLPVATRERVLDDLLDRVRGQHMLSLVDFDLAAPGSRQQSISL